MEYETGEESGGFFSAHWRPPGPNLLYRKRFGRPGSPLPKPLFQQGGWRENLQRNHRLSRLAHLPGTHGNLVVR